MPEKLEKQINSRLNMPGLLKPMISSVNKLEKICIPCGSNVISMLLTKKNELKKWIT